MSDFNKLRFHISGSISNSISAELIKLTHNFIKKLVIEILKGNGHFTITYGDELKVDDLSLIFDYTIIEGIKEFYLSDLNEEKPIVFTILYHSYKNKIPLERKLLISDLMKYDFVRIKELPQLSSYGGKLRSELAKKTDVLIILGGSRGVNDLAEKCLQENKILIPSSVA